MLLLLQYWNLLASYKLHRRLRNIFPRQIYFLSMVFLRFSSNPLPFPPLSITLTMWDFRKRSC
jgi:hypothetical protein